MVLNTICHANYFIRSNIKIEYFPDKAKITSPGGIFNASMDDIMNGVQTYRNPRLVHVFDKLGMIENFGTGIPRTMESYKNYDVKPELKATGNFFFVTLPNVNYLKNDSITDPISDLGLEIMKALKLNPGINTIKLSEIIQTNLPSVSRDMIKNELKRNLTIYVEHHGSNRNGGYYLKSKDDK